MNRQDMEANLESHYLSRCIAREQDIFRMVIERLPTEALEEIIKKLGIEEKDGVLK